MIGGGKRGNSCKGGALNVVVVRGRGGDGVEGLGFRLRVPRWGETEE